MTNEFIIHTGSILREYIDEIGISEKECAKNLDISEGDFVKLLDGKSILTNDIAEKLNKIIPDVPTSYWMNYEKKYRDYLANKNAHLSHYSVDDLRLFARRFKFNEIFSGLGWDINRQASEMLKLLGISSFEDFDLNYANLNVDFMEDGGEKEAIAIWLNLAKEEIELQNKDLS